MVKDILNNGRHFLQTQFGILDRLYLYREWNVVSEVDQIAFCLEWKNPPSKLITLHVVADKVRTKLLCLVVTKKNTVQTLDLSVIKQKLKRK